MKPSPQLKQDLAPVHIHVNVGLVLSSNSQIQPCALNKRKRKFQVDIGVEISTKSFSLYLDQFNICGIGRRNHYMCVITVIIQQLLCVPIKMQLSSTLKSTIFWQWNCLCDGLIIWAHNDSLTNSICESNVMEVQEHAFKCNTIILRMSLDL